ncbi:MAG TPA: LemA family protein [Thermoanaerobaculia bacterium]|nr:LemA family protein [Thermoanaerobaculia bacterium]
MRRGLIVLLVIVGLVVVLVATLASQYNRLVNLQEDVTSQWANVESSYQRRADLIPNLVATVKGSAQFEQETLRQVVEARAKVGQVTAQAGAGTPNDPAALQRFAQAQDQLSSALSRLLVVVERYPDIKSTQAFRDLMPALEGTENRINVERNRYNELARTFNATRRRVPVAWFINALGWDFPPKAYFEAQAGAATAPKVQF